MGAGIARWVVCWAHCRCVMQRRGFDPLLRKSFPVEGIFPLELTWVLTPFPQNSFGWEYEPRTGLCTHTLHRTDSKDPDIHVLDGWVPATKTHPACTIDEDGMWLSLWLDFIFKKTTKNQQQQQQQRPHRQKSHPKWWTPEIYLGNVEEEVQIDPSLRYIFGRKLTKKKLSITNILPRSSSIFLHCRWLPSLASNSSSTYNTLVSQGRRSGACKFPSPPPKPHPPSPPSLIYWCFRLMK